MVLQVEEEAMEAMVVLRQMLIDHPEDVFADGAGNLFIGDEYN